MRIRLAPLLGQRKFLLRPNIKQVSTTAALYQHDFSNVHAPKQYNFVKDQIEVIAAEEQKSGKLLAYWWFDNIGNELKLSYSDLAEQSKM